ncbi:TetR/AcrR family transcriptional regulator [Actinomyces weissii]|uniref:TetR/AcrR family transcriptional regulator n=1 Tax=Actinomyces weissii TaxID=675090 RepID=A0A7T7MAP4_9ACTO|nr:TetR/AcrR family transcriptional regulator [Actinomyces weissii]QQM67442.1 TetR/AcrR family transcriptional regulator [Actinomyces weissii]
MSRKVNQVRQAEGVRVSARRAAVSRAAAAAPSSRRARTQRLLLEAGLQLIAEQGIGATSVGDVCARAGFSRGAFYSNFRDMDHFVGRLAEEQWAAMAEFVRSAVAVALPDGSRTSRPSEQEVAASAASLADRLLQAMPVSRESHLLQSEFAAFIVRDAARAPALKAGYEAFKDSLREQLVSGLAAIGRRTIASPEDTTELILAAAERSVRLALMDGEEGGALTAFLERTLPLLLTRLSVPEPG